MKIFLFILFLPFILSADIWIETDWSESESYDSLYNIENKRFPGELRLHIPSNQTWLDTIQLENIVSIISLEQTPDGVLWAGTKGGKVFKSTDGGIEWDTVTQIPNATDIYDLAVNIDGSLITSKSPAPGGIYRWDSIYNIWELLGNSISNRKVRSLLVDPHGFIYVGTGDTYAEIWMYDPVEDTTTKRVTISGGKIIHTLIRTTNGVMWAGGETASGGFVARSDDGWATYEIIGSFPSYVRSVYSLASSQDTIFAGTGDTYGTIFFLEDTNWLTLLDTPYLQKASSILHINNILYVSGTGYDEVNTGYVIAMRNDNWQVFPTITGIFDCPSILVDNTGFLLAGTKPGGILKSGYSKDGFIISKTYDIGTDNGSSEFERLMIDASETGGLVEVRIRSFNDSSSIISWDSCSVIPSGSSLEDINSITNGDRYIQYKIDMETENQMITPIVYEIGIEYTIDTLPPYIVYARASDGSDSLIPGIDTDDYVEIRFSESILDTPGITPTNIDYILSLSPEGTWLNGLGLMCGAVFIEPDLLRWEPLLWPPSVDPPSVSVGDTIFPHILTDIWGNPVTGFCVIDGSFYEPDTISPFIISSIAYDAGGEKAGDGDSVIITFSEIMEDVVFEYLDSILKLSSSHTWGEIDTAIQRQLDLKIILKNGPTISIGDTIYPNGEILKDRHGNPCCSLSIITGNLGGRLTATACATNGLFPEQEIEDGDFVRIDFNRRVSLTGELSSNTIDDVLSLSDFHTWFPCQTIWNIDSTSLVIVFHPQNDTPTVCIGDIVYPDSVTIIDKHGRYLYKPFLIEGELQITENNFDSISPELRLIVYPNPARERVVIEIEEGREKISVSIYDLSGRFIKQIKGSSDKSYGLKFIWNRKDKSGNRVPSGIYFCTIKSISRRDWKKIILF
ncbi:T9SS type A sorting domain-containing protein [candidate division WOR-3 bacterium]|nr:T9SS type A sorting domain-containing protein [candidate division WOR-3 bacterium]